MLALVTGVPGSGKTFLGLKYVYDICKSGEETNSVYLSGNGPLIKVLTDALQSDVFVKSIHTVVNEYAAGRTKEYNKNIMVFDEGQRAWDKKRMLNKRGIAKSEPDILVELADRKLEWSVLLILVGEGQELNFGEFSGIGQWDTALKSSQHKWEVICPDNYASTFKDHTVIVNNNFNLTTSLRSYLAKDVSSFVNFLIDGKMPVARRLAPSILKSGFNMYITRDVEKAKSYCRKRYGGDHEKRYGLMASNKSSNLKPYGMQPPFQPDVAKWFNGKSYEKGSCRSFNVTISEFDCQGLEIDMPIIGWGNDMLWNGQEWSKYKENEDANSEMNSYRRNTYRVLLTRGRDGFIIFVPDQRELDSTYDVLVKVGLKDLEV